MPLEQAAADLRAEGMALAAAKCDVRVSADIDAPVTLAKETYRFPDVVYANAGIFVSPRPPWDISEEEFTSIVDMNLMGTWRTLKAVLPGMVERGSGAVVATASVAGMAGADGVAAHVARKHGVVGLVKSDVASNCFGSNFHRTSFNYNATR